MIVIAIADDEKCEQETLVSYYNELQKEVQEELIVRVYDSGEALLDAYDGGWDIVCLDIDMSGQDGIETARKLRETDRQVIIIFITNMAQMAIRGYEVQALDFIVKPVNYFSFAMKMKNAFDIIQNRKSKNIVVGTTGGIRRFSTDVLYYAEVDGHYLYYHTKEGVFRQKASLKELEEKLEGLSFKRCNNCYLVNLKHVECVNKDDIKVGGDWLKISRPRKREFLQSLANYMGGISI
jgi:DNA-binding LytR/AlgR family response regulator